MSTTIGVCESDECTSTFEPRVHNQAYCSQKCKRHMENVRRQTVAEEPLYDEQTWQAQETKKLLRAEESIAKSEWILGTRTFAGFDIESTQLDADFGRIICACIKPLGGEIKTFYTKRYDNKIAGKIRDELKKYDYIITWYGTGFDMKFLAARLMENGLENIGLLRHLDMYYTSKSHLKLASHRLSEVAKSILGGAERTPVVARIWQDAGYGDKEALQYVIDHCRADMNDLEGVFRKLTPFRNLGATPLRIY